MRALLLFIIPSADIALAPLTYIAGCILKLVRRAGVHRLPKCKNALLKVGVFPIRNHYHEPRFDYRHSIDFRKERFLPGIEWNISGQTELLNKLIFSGELLQVPVNRPKSPHATFFMNNYTFMSGDAEYWYQIIRALKPSRIYEIGSGNSTLMAVNAVNMNRKQDKSYRCEHVCIEPYEMPWLESTGVSVIREKVETLSVEFFRRLEASDVLFIDSSHVIRPGGDVLFEYLELLPSLNPGVIVHIHDIFSPRDYPSRWVVDEVKFWNEQYLVEAFLTNNPNWEILGSLNYLHHNHYDKLKSVAPSLTPESEPGSFYIRKK
jgi:hypothetical protein